MPLDPRHVKALFVAAIEREDPADRATFLDRECGDDDELRRRLDQILAAIDQPESSPGGTADDPSGPTIRLEGPRVEPKKIPRSVDFTSPVGSTIGGRYKIRQEIGEGGMGSVFLAEQSRPVKRMVALKLIKPGMDTRTVLARFDSERQALAIMDHPNIARVLDAGTTDAGRPFFVMDLVKGVPITDYCDRHRLGLRERLALFKQVCGAVQHAHQKGIIHRDLKPTNILVEDHDGHPVPKVIDFGLAKATSGLQLTDQSLFTAFGAITGTPRYMAPEQATFSTPDVDTRTDIYALGVILYELLTGSTPIRRESLHNAELDEILRVVREDDPPTPSQRISMSDKLPSLSANRLIEPTRLGRFVRGDLDWVVMKALDKERSRRYNSAIGLANDVERFLNDEPVSAGPPTARYRMGKFIRRHRGQVVAASLVLLALVGGMVGTTLGLVEARRQERETRLRDVALAEAIEKKEAARQAEAEQHRRAERRLTQVEKANEILGSIFKDLNPRNAEKAGKPLAALLGERLDQATAAIEGESIGDPVAVARMQITLGQSQLGLGYPQRAIALFVKSRETLALELGPDHSETLDSVIQLAMAHAEAGQVDRALPLLERAVATRERKLGPDHAEALASVIQLATAHAEAGQVDRALPLLERAVATRERKLGPDHPDTLVGMGHLASAYQKAGQVDRALPLLERAVATRERKLGPDHPQTVSNRDLLTWIYENTKIGRLHRTLMTLEQTLALQKATLGLENPDIRGTLCHLSLTYGELGRYDEAIAVHEKQVLDLDRKCGPNHEASISARDDLATEYWHQNRNAEMIPVRLATLKARDATLGSDHPETFDNLRKLAGDYRNAGLFPEAIGPLERSLKTYEAKFGRDRQETLEVRLFLAEAYEADGQLDRALPILREVLVHRDCLGELSYGEGLASLGRCLLRREKWAEAEPVMRESLSILEREARDPWMTLDARSMLGGALLGQKKSEEAKPLLVAGFEGMKRRFEPTSSNRGTLISDALDRLITLAEMTGEPDKAQAWRQEKVKLCAPPASAPKPEPAKP